MARPTGHSPKHVEIPTLTQDHVVALLALQEPNRTSQWLQCCCFDDSTSEISEESMWLAYNALLSHHNPLHPIPSAEDFFSTVVKTFRYTTAIRRAHQPNTYIVTGIRARRMPLPPKFIKMKPIEETTPDPALPDAPSISPSGRPDSKAPSSDSQPIQAITEAYAKILATYKEPVRCRVWMNACFLADSNGIVARDVMWQTYQGTFGQTTEEQDDCLSLTRFAKCISSTFPQTSLQTLSDNDGPLIKGISPRKAIFDFVLPPTPRSLLVTNAENPDTTTKDPKSSSLSPLSSATSTGKSTPSSDGSAEQLIKGSDHSTSPNTAVAKKLPAETVMVSIHELETNGVQLPDLKDSTSCCTQENVDIAKLKRFSLDFLATLIRHGALALVSDYLSAFPEAESSLDKYYVSGEWPLIFFAIERNDVEAVKFMLKYGDYGVLPSMASSSHKIPVLAYAILLGEQAHVNTLEVVKLLLAAGADPSGIPRDMWQDYMERPSALLPSGKAMMATQTLWCTAGLRKRLANAVTLSQRYYLWKADQQPRMKERTAHADQILGISALRQLPYWLVGQDQASKVAALTIFDHLAFAETKPLTLLFSGPSGHGKTELAQRLAGLLEVELTYIDCAPIRNQWGLLGSDPGYIACQDGSKLNNFLADNNGARTVVFLDEIDKSVKEVWDALLVLFGSGRFLDKRHSKDIDCSKTIFIMATNQGDKVIEKHWKAHPQGSSAEDIETLQCELQTNFIKKFGAPFTGRIRSIVPFMPFTPGEQAVIAHGFMLNILDRLRRPIDTARKSLIAHGHLDIQRDEGICKHIAEKSYVMELGARAIENAVIQKVRLPLDSLWREDAKGVGKVDESMNETALIKYVVQLEPLKSAKGQSRVKVAEGGLTELPVRESILYKPVEKPVAKQ